MTKVAKPGSGLSNIVQSSAFASTYPTSRAKPTSITDGRGNVTDFTYDPVHGGVLTESAPADANGIRAVKRYAYAQRYAWITNGSGYVQASSPVWLMTEMRTCIATATVGNGCAGGAADEVVTSYDYGPNSGPNNLLLRGQAVTAGGVTLRTCYTYDQWGNKISETSPNANLSACS